MNKFDFETSTWYRAVTLTERIASQNKLNNQNKNFNLAQEGTQKAKKKIENWQSYPWFANEDYFTQRLEMEGITKEELENILAEPIESVQKRYSTQPLWLSKIEQIFTQNYHVNSLNLLDNSIPENIKGFLNIIKPLINHSRNLLHQEIKELINTEVDLPFNPNTIGDLLLIDLPQRLLRIITKTLVLELNVARLQNQLTGNTPEERFHSFVEHLSQPEQFIHLLKEYPVMARQLVIALENWLNFSLEFIHNLCDDWSKIQQTFSNEKTDKLIKLDNGGDSHRGNRSVLICTFSSGFKIIYKPKSLAIDVHFQDLLSWINKLDEFLPFKTLKILDRSNYGWVEFIENKPCNSIAEVKNFYTRQGGYLALLYILNASDFHHENLIATGEHPFLIDLETLFHPRIGKFNFDKASQSANLVYQNSVLKVGLLPVPIWSNNDSQGIDLSGLGTVGTQLTPHRVPYWEGLGTDEMKLESSQMEITANNHRPSINGIEINLLDFPKEIITGFKKIYQLVLKHKNELLSNNSHLLKFANDEIRVVIRHTQKYGLLLQDSFHPDVLRDAISRDQLFDKLWSEVKNFPYLAQTISAECEDLQNGDIPFFRTTPNSRDLFTSSGKVIPDFLAEPSLKSVVNCLQQMGEKDLKRQIWYIKASLATLAARDKEKNHQPSYGLTATQIVANPSQLLALAEEIAIELDSLAIRGQDDVTWIGLNLIKEKNYTLLPSGLDLYGGLPGITLFFAYLAELTGKENYLQLAKASFKSIQYQIKEAKKHLQAIGGFAGWGGVIYTLTHLAILWKQDDLLNDAQEIVKLLPNLIEQDEQLDIIGGSAGCIASLVSLYRCQPSSSILEVALQCGKHLVSKAHYMKNGVGWLSKQNQTSPLTGFSHGNAGIAWSLLELSQITGEESFKKVALEAIAYERSLFIPEVSNWPDLRDFETAVLKEKTDKPEHNCMNAWCHGAPGIGLARLASLSYLDNARIRSEISTALKTTKEQGMGNNHSLCHGDLGNLELLLQASIRLDETYWKSEVDNCAAMIIESINTHGWLCGVPLGAETPGLMTGLAGIGYQLMRLAKPECVPSVLLLEAPRLNHKK